MCSNYSGIKLEPAPGTWENKIERLSSYAHVVHTSAKQVISRRRKNENVSKCQKIKNARASVQKYCFSSSNMQICCRRRLRQRLTKATAIGTPEYRENRAARSLANLMYCAHNYAKTNLKFRRQRDPQQ